MRKILIWCFITVTLVFAVYKFHINKKTIVSQNMFKNTVNKEIPAFRTSSPVNIITIGDSIAKGTGDEKGNGISTYLPEYLKDKMSRNISVYNAGVNGLKSSGLVEALNKEEMIKKICDSDIIVISIGGNDVLSIYSVSDSKKLAALKAVQDKYLDNLKTVLKK